MIKWPQGIPQRNILDILLIHILLSVYMYVFADQSATSRMWHKVILSGVLLEFRVFFLLDWLRRESNLLYNLLIADGRTDGFMPFTKTFARNETQTALCRIWTQVADSIS